MPEAPPLTPMSLNDLLRRIHHEWTSRQRIFDLPSARIWKPAEDIDLSFEFLGRPAASPIGPAAGPHSQMAQNIVLAWLGGSRLFELKTVQVIDDLDIARPCIDMETIGYNIEWSQELEVHQSLEEYVKAWMIIEILRRWEPLAEHLGPDTGPHVFDLSVGYDLAGIQSEKVAGFIRAMGNASTEIERLRPEIPDLFGDLAEIEFPSTVSDSVTLSTFHGCPPDEIEAITKYLIDDHDVDVIVKLNPTLLGFDRVSDIVNAQLGYDSVILVPTAFEADLQFGRAISLIRELNQYAKDRGHRFGIKLTNTLVVANEKQWMPEDTMYLSGPPLHVLATALADELAAALPGQLMLPGHDGDIQVSFSAGVVKENLVDTIAMGVRPATICSDLLKPGGYGRLAPMLRTLTEAVRASGSTELESWRTGRLNAANQDGHRDLVAVHLARVLGDDKNRYSLEGNSKLPRSVDHKLETWGCVACNFCVTVCPNDAFFKIPTAGLEGLEGRQQYLLFSELCNDCGNCLTFCPEDGDPAQIKPRLYLDKGRFDAADGPRFLLGGTGQVTAIPAGGADEDLGTLVALLNSDEGLPLPLQATVTNEG
ncbi:MAG: 4Fe-4S dicluster domain-containing protein [Acidimicrobiaceae bacterium]|jgi:putative selenate reductase|nr:4Fe-4S dicluster domain-containing protein [Acidimicrobiaceae bacterium]MBT5579669.1 4Fe-4S dicluster domain-containing protein [Acidimicrobiaceae bacterium]